MMTRKRIMIAGGAVLLISALLIASFGGSRRHGIEAAGLIEAVEVNVGARLAEQITAVPYQEGDRVAIGAVVVRLEDQKIRAEVLQARADLEHARASAAEARRQRDRMVRLFAEGVASEADRDAAQTRDDLSQAEIRQREAALTRTQARLADTVITSPLAGVVALRAFEPGEVVTPGATILTLVDPDHLWARLELDETLTARVRLGDPASIRAAGLPGRAFAGHVVEIGPEGEFATLREVTRGRQDVKTFRVKVAIERPEGFLKPGMSVMVRIEPQASPQPLAKISGP